jgi:hypothetical protein
MIGDLVHKKTIDNQQILIPFNKDLLVRSIDYFPASLAENASNLQKAIYSIRSDKLEIYEIRNLCLLDEDNIVIQGSEKSCLNRPKSQSFIK